MNHVSHNLNSPIVPLSSFPKFFFALFSYHLSHRGIDVGEQVLDANRFWQIRMGADLDRFNSSLVAVECGQNQGKIKSGYREIGYRVWGTGKRKII